MLLNTCNTPVMANTVWKSKNNPAIGIKKIEDPKPPIVPTISASKASIKNKIKIRF